MKTLLFVNPLKAGKFSEYKKFVAEITGPRKKEYVDLLKRYHLKTANVWHQKIGDKEYIIVYHEIAGEVKDPLAAWSSSTHPFDVWFKEQLNNLHDMSGITPPEFLFHFEP